MITYLKYFFGEKEEFFNPTLPEVSVQQWNINAKVDLLTTNYCSREKR